MLKPILLWSIVLLACGCAARPVMELPADHPARPDAPAGAPLAMSDVLRPTTMPATAPAKPQLGGHHHAH